MSDIFKVIADANARLVLETLADNPQLTAAGIETASELKPEQVEKQLASLSDAGLIKSLGSGKSKKYSLNAKGFTPYLSWLAKVAEAQAVSSLELQLVDLGEKLGNAVAAGSDWITEKVAENLDVDPKKLGKELGRVFADLKTDVQREAKGLAKEADRVVQEVSQEATKLVDDVKSKIKR